MKDGDTALICAAKGGCAEVGSKLVISGAKVDPINKVSSFK